MSDDTAEHDQAHVLAESIVDTIRQPFLVLSEDLRVQSANRAFYQAFRVDRAETEGRLIYELGNGQWDIPRLRTLLEEIIPEERQQEVFEIFRRLHPRDVYPGDGVGLALCRRIVARHDGRIWAESPPDGQEMGTAFPFTMPKDQERPQP